MGEGQRVNLGKQAPAVYEAMTALAGQVRAFTDQTGLEALLGELVKIRASQLNGCAFCLDMHHRGALEHGEDPRRLAMLAAWREARSWFSDRERAALELTESVTLVADGRVSDEVYGRAAAVLDRDEMTAVAWLAITMNAFNRIAITSGYEAPRPAQPAPAPKIASTARPG